MKPFSIRAALIALFIISTSSLFAATIPLNFGIEFTRYAPGAGPASYYMTVKGSGVFPARIFSPSGREYMPYANYRLDTSF